MSNPSAAQIAAFQAASQAVADLTIVIKRNTAGSSDGAGGTSESLTTVATVSGNIDQPSAGLLQNYDYLVGALAAWQVRVPAGTNVKENDVLVVSGLKLRVDHVLPRSRLIGQMLLASEVA